MMSAQNLNCYFKSLDEKKKSLDEDLSWVSFKICFKLLFLFKKYFLKIGLKYLHISRFSQTL